MRYEVPQLRPRTLALGALLALLTVGPLQAYVPQAPGGVRARGLNSPSRLGDSTTASQAAPVVTAALGGVGPLSGVVSLAAGQSHCLAARSDGGVLAWGSGLDGRLGDGSGVDRPTPVSVASVGGGGTLTNVVAVSAGASHSLALRADGTVVAWGLNDHGQLGDGTTLSRSAPVQVLGVGGTGVLNSVVAVWAGASHSVALRSDGSVVAWGYNADGELGNNATADGLSPVQVQGSTGSGALTGVLSLSAGGSHTVALRSDGRVLSWGLNTDGQLGNNSTASSGTPARVRAVGGAGFLINVASVAAGGCHSLALLKDGTANCWGANGSGQLGNGAAVSQSTPV